MSRMGVVRWLPTEDFVAEGNSSTNSSFMAFSPSTKEEWIQTDIFISACVIAAALISAHSSSLSKVGVSTLFALVSLFVTLSLAPVLGAILLACALYRRLVEAVLRLTVGPHFMGLLHGSDAFWAIEDESSRSVINVLGLADFSFIVAASTQDDEPLQTISELIQDRLLSHDPRFSKLMCLRQLSRFGYYYWEKLNSISINEHIHWMNLEDQGDQTITEACLKNYVSSVVNMPLPLNNAAGWEILVGRYPIKPSSDLLDAMENGGWITKSCVGVRYPVLFRIHHSIGDGVALVNLFLDSLADPPTRCTTPVSTHRCTSPYLSRNYVRSKTPTIEEEPEEECVNSSWQESDIPKYSKSSSCDLKPICLDIPINTESAIKKSSTFDFGDCVSLNPNRNDNVNGVTKRFQVAFKRFCQFIDEHREAKTNLNKNKMKEFEIVVNDRPSGEFLELIKNATNFENQLSMVSGRKYFQCFLRFQLATYFSTDKIMKLIMSLKSVIEQWSVLLMAPASLLSQIITQTQDSNLLHGPKLSGHKVVAWYFEQQDISDQLLMSMIKRIRAKTGVRFSDVLLTALSASLESFYAQSNEIPSFITVVVPARLGMKPVAKETVIKTTKLKAKVTKLSDSFNNNLENNFSVAMLPLPICTGMPSRSLRLFCKLRHVRRHCERLRNSPDYLVNYWLLRVVATLLPAPILRPLVASTHSTLVLSNLPGPKQLTFLAGHTVHDLVFWIPHRTTTGVGVTVLSYAGRLQLGLMADRALVACQQDAQLILDGIATAIQQMDNISSPA